MKNINWVKIKPAVEVVAILGAGIFTFFTWGIDALRVTAPNWAVSIEQFKQYTTVNNNGKVSICDVETCSEATSCKIEGTVVTENKGRSPIDLRDTDFDIYVIRRPDSESIFNSSAYEFISKTCIKNNSPDCMKPTLEFLVAGISDQVLYPAQQGWRPFSIDVNPSDLGNQEKLDDFSKANQLLIIATQKIVPSTINPFYLLPDNFNPFFKEQEGKVAYMVSNICDRNTFKSKDNICKDDKKCIKSQIP